MYICNKLSGPSIKTLLFLHLLRQEARSAFVPIAAGDEVAHPALHNFKFAPRERDGMPVEPA